MAASESEDKAVRPTFLLLETIHPDALGELEATGNVLFAPTLEQALAAGASTQVDVLLTRGRGQVAPRLMDACPGVKVIARVGVGLDNVDVAAATDRGITVINAPGSTTTATSEHTFTLIAALVRGLVPMTSAVRAGQWSRRSDYRGDDLSGKSLGIIGMGAIGHRVAELATAFGMEVAYWNRSPRNVSWPRKELDELLSESDVVSVNVALTPETRGLLGRGELASMKLGAVLVNTARGAIIDQAALVDALAAGRLGGFGADVLSQEPPDAADALLGCDNVVITPHVAALTESTYRGMCLRTVGNVLRLLRGEMIDPRDVVNR